jgi:exopolyphosphatase/guanosine-5'-triphosphate,3'-diphosphate pyrophosphatase
MARVFAAADIGSNTAHLLVAATDGDIVLRLDNLNDWIPLGEIVAKHGMIPKAQADQLVASMKEFRKVAGSRRAGKIYVFGTEAIRTANNHIRLLKRIEQESGISVELISPRREAELSFIGVRMDTAEANPDILFEVGGGSAQIAQVDGDTLGDEISLPLGTGRVIAETDLVHPYSPELVKKATTYIQKHLKNCSLPIRAKSGAVSGGVARGLWRALHPDGHKRLAMEELEYLIWSTQRLSLDATIARFDVKPKRAGTLLPGALVYLALMQKFQLAEVMVSEFGVREGAILEMARGNIKGQNP